MTFTFTQSDQAARIKPSATLALNKMAADLKSQGHDVIAFTVGEPDKKTPDFVGAAMAEFAAAGNHKYASPAPAPNAKAIAEKFKRDNGLVYRTEQITAGVGGKELVFWSIGTAINPGDEVVIPAPYWVSYPEIVNFFGGETRAIIPNADNLKISPEELRAAITAKTKMVILNQPSNPAGVVYTRDELAAMADVLRDSVKTNPQLVIITDDIYEKLVYGQKFCTLAEIAPDLAERILIINGLSKSHAFTGARYGYCAGHTDWIKAINKMISQSSTHVPTIIQAGALAALQGTEDFLIEWCADYVRRRDFVLGQLHNMGVACAKPDGAFYVFPKITDFIGKTHKGKKIATDENFVMALLSEKKVGCVHGSAFGMPGYMRISYATSDDNLRRGLDRIAEFCSEIARENNMTLVAIKNGHGNCGKSQR